MPFYSDRAVTIWNADALRLPLSDASVDLIVTSPPYFGLRSYQDGGEHYDGQLGSEATPAEFVDALIAATREMVRVLKPGGSIFVNLGDRYGDRSLLALPSRYVIRCMDELGLIQRAEIIWSKTSSFIDAKAAGRVRRTHEVVYHLTRQGEHYENAEALRQRPAKDYRDRPQFRRAMQLFQQAGFGDQHLAAVKAVGVADSLGGQVRSGGSWDSESGRLAAEVRAVLRSYYRELCGSNVDPKGNLPGSVWEIPVYPFKSPKHLAVKHFAGFPVALPLRIIRGWCPPGGRVLDPFGGSGTTGIAAKALGMSSDVVDLSADYCRLARWRCTDATEMARAREIAGTSARTDSLLDLLPEGAA